MSELMTMKATVIKCNQALQMEIIRVIKLIWISPLAVELIKRQCSIINKIVIGRYYKNIISEINFGSSSLLFVILGDTTKNLLFVVVVIVVNSPIDTLIILFIL